jgi:hypothetical protein
LIYVLISKQSFTWARHDTLGQNLYFAASGANRNAADYCKDAVDLQGGFGRVSLGKAIAGFFLLQQTSLKFIYQKLNEAFYLCRLEATSAINGLNG